MGRTICPTKYESIDGDIRRPVISPSMILQRDPASDARGDNREENGSYIITADAYRGYEY